MPNIKSVRKDVLRSRQRNLRNQSIKSKIKTYIKKADKTILTGDGAEIQTAVSKSISVVDKAAKRGVIHKNAAARRKSRLMRRANRALAASAPEPTAA